MEKKVKKGKIRVGRSTYDSSGRIIYPSYNGFEQIVVIMKSHSKYFTLSPYYLKDSKGRIMENMWQFSKIYEVVPKSEQIYSRYDRTIIWSYPEERHIERVEIIEKKEDKILPSYWKWRNKGMNNEHAVRYPVGFKNKSLCKYAIPENDITQKLDYIDSRIQIYVPLYCELVKAHLHYLELQKMLNKGINLLIIEPDGPHQESMNYYKSEWFVEDDFIEKNTMLITKDNLSTMLLDTKHAFGHGYCLAMALLNITPEKLLKDYV